mgnify:CR=1 FL=1
MFGGYGRKYLLDNENGGDGLGKHRDRGLERTLQETINSGKSVWVIGDVHGHILTLKSLIKKLEMSEGDKLVSLGDLIDRGADSAAVLRLFLENPNYHLIRGNHEDLMLRCLCKQKRKACKSWLKYGGLQTLESFGVSPEEKVALADDWCDFLESAPSEIVLDKHRLVHAGINPARPIQDQIENDRLWSRSVFEFNLAPDPQRQVLIGHTPTQEIDGHRSSAPWFSEFTTENGRPAIIALDTGIFLEKNQQPKLTALELRSNKFIQMLKIEDD